MCFYRSTPGKSFVLRTGVNFTRNVIDTAVDRCRAEGMAIRRFVTPSLRSKHISRNNIRIPYRCHWTREPPARGVLLISALRTQDFTNF